MSNDVPTPGTPRDRRSFLTTLGGAALAASGISALACATKAATNGRESATTVPSPTATSTGAKIRPIGVQLYTVRDEMKRDVAATLARVAQIGYTEVEFAGYFDHTPAEIRAMLDQNHLTAPSAHIPLQQLQGDMSGVIAAAKTIGHEYITVPALIPPLMGKVADDFWSKTAAEFNRVGKALKAEGIGFAYHNHNFEFVKLADGRTGYDVLVAETDPAVVSFELDLLWATLAGQDPVALFAKNPGRYVMWHVKDVKGVDAARTLATSTEGTAMQKLQKLSGSLAAVGTGDIDFRRIFAAASTSGMRHFFVENDSAPQTASSLADIETSYKNLRQMLA